MVTTPKIPAQFLARTHIQGLSGRVLELPASAAHADRLPALLIYGHHSSLERMYSLAQAVNEHAPVVLPDMPGFGGMPSLTTIGKKPNTDGLADYLAAFVRQRFPDGQRFVVGGMSLGFVVVVRMLQRHPELLPQVAHLFSLVGFVHYNDFNIAPRKRRFFVRVARTMARRPTAKAFDNLILRKPFIATTYNLRARSHPKMKGYTWTERQNLIDFEVILWKTNEVRTYFTTMAEMLNIDLTAQPLPLPVEHVAVSTDQYFDNHKVVEHLKQMFTSVHIHYANMPNHAPTVVEDVADARQMIPNSLWHIFANKS
ncbi:MAG TPA: alpha/beta hydrolase [Candidatus Saccharimonadales bacterium]|nr:alpha/beta hydrolase [Candidatus Saccharimonadales bacterium]